jgi:predicted aspartyl protease
MTPSHPPVPASAFTCRYTQGIALALINEVEIFSAFAFTPPAAPLGGIKYKALYDTGATHSAVSPKVVKDLSLPSIGATNVGVGGGTLTTTTHLVNIGFPNGVMFQMIRVAEVALHRDVDALIGMDIISQGDFAVTNHNGKTTFSFCCPSRREIDFVAEIQAPARSDKVGRNQPCPCGSGEKYKYCHGKV